MKIFFDGKEIESFFTFRLSGYVEREVVDMLKKFPKVSYLIFSYR